MKPIITKFHPKTGDIEITIPVPYTDPWEEHINYPMPAYEEREVYNIFALIKENQELKKQLEVKEAQQKEFIELLENKANEAQYHVREFLAYQLILLKYKEIVGVSDES